MKAARAEAARRYRVRLTTSHEDVYHDVITWLSEARPSAGVAHDFAGRAGAARLFVQSGTGGNRVLLLWQDPGAGARADSQSRAAWLIIWSVAGPTGSTVPSSCPPGSCRWSHFGAQARVRRSPRHRWQSSGPRVAPPSLAPRPPTPGSFSADAFATALRELPPPRLRTAASPARGQRSRWSHPAPPKRARRSSPRSSSRGSARLAELWSQRRRWRPCGPRSAFERDVRRRRPRLDGRSRGDQGWACAAARISRTPSAPCRASLMSARRRARGASAYLAAQHGVRDVGMGCRDPARRRGRGRRSPLHARPGRPPSPRRRAHRQLRLRPRLPGRRRRHHRRTCSASTPRGRIIESVIARKEQRRSSVPTDPPRSTSPDPDRPALDSREDRRARGRSRPASRSSTRSPGTSSSRSTGPPCQGSFKRAPRPQVAGFLKAATQTRSGAASTSERRSRVSRLRSRGRSRGRSAKGFRRAFSDPCAGAVPKHASLVGNVYGRFYLNLTQFMRIAAQVPWLDARALVELGAGRRGRARDADDGRRLEEGVLRALPAGPRCACSRSSSASTTSSRATRRSPPWRRAHTRRSIWPSSPTKGSRERSSTSRGSWRAPAR